MAGSRNKPEVLNCIRVDLNQFNKNQGPLTIADIPLIRGTPDIDLNMQAARLVHRTGLTAWTEPGRQFIADHVLILPAVKINNATVWFSDGDINPVQAAIIKKRLRCVAGLGPEPHAGDREGFNGWGFSPGSLEYARFSGQDDEG